MPQTLDEQVVQSLLSFSASRDNLLWFVQSTPNFRSRWQGCARAKCEVLRRRSSKVHHRKVESTSATTPSVSIALGKFPFPCVYVYISNRYLVMELRRAADALLRTQSSFSFLTPSIRWQPGLCNSIKGGHGQIHRTFASSSRLSALPTGKSPTTEAKPAESSSEQATPSWTSRERTSRFSPPGRMERTLNGGDSAKLLLDSLNEARSSSPKFDFGRMADPRPDVTDIMRNVNETVAAPPAPKEPMRLVPSTGRTIPVGTNVDIGRALRLLEQSCARNKVRSDFTRQRFHERGGLKRKRLRRERWKKKFMTGFKQYIDRVKLLKKQGW